MQKLNAIININNGLNNQIFGQENLIHKPEFQLIRDLIDFDLKEVENYKSNGLPYRQSFPNTISILGSNGSGRSFFIQSIMDDFRNHDDKQIVILDQITPNMIEKKSHILLNIISQIQNLIDENLASIDCYPDSVGYCTKQCWERCLEKLAISLSSIDYIEVEQNKDIQDAEYMMYKRLKSVDAIKQLKHDFHNFINKSLKILGQSVFMIAFDDIDKNSVKGWMILEMIREYLNIPEIITLICGDLKLISKIVQKYQTKDIEVLLSENNQSILEIEKQYLQKVLPISRRVELQTFLEKINLYPFYNIQIEINQKLSEITDSYLYHLKLLGLTSKTNTIYIVKYLLSLPVRSQILFFSLFYEKKIDNHGNVILYPIKSVQLFNLIDLFVNELPFRNVLVEMALKKPQFINTFILKFLTEQKILAQRCNLQPVSTQLEVNSSLFAFNLLFIKHTAYNPSLIFDYFIRINFLSNLLSDHLICYSSKNEHNSNKIIIDHLISCFELDQPISIKNFLSSVFNLSRSTLNNTSFKGIIPLYTTNCDKSFYQAYAKAEESSDKNIAILLNLPRTISQSKIENQNIENYSIYTLIAVIADFLKVKSNNIKCESFRLSESDDNHLFNVYDYIDYNFKNTKNLLIPSINNEIIQLTNEWKNLYPSLSISPYLLAKIAERLYFELKSSLFNDNLGDLFNQHIIIFLNAVLIEDFNEQYPDHKIENNRNDKSMFINNLQIIEKYYKIVHTQEESELSKNFLSFSLWILSCPIILVFLNQKTRNIIKQFVKKIDGNISSTYKENLDIFLNKYKLYSVLKDIPFFDKNVVIDELQNKINENESSIKENQKSKAKLYNRLEILKKMQAKLSVKTFEIKNKYDKLKKDKQKKVIQENQQNDIKKDLSEKLSEKESKKKETDLQINEKKREELKVKKEIFKNKFELENLEKDANIIISNNENKINLKFNIEFLLITQKIENIRNTIKEKIILLKDIEYELDELYLKNISQKLNIHNLNNKIRKIEILLQEQELIDKELKVNLKKIKSSLSLAKYLKKKIEEQKKLIEKINEIDVNLKIDIEKYKTEIEQIFIVFGLNSN